MALAIPISLSDIDNIARYEERFWSYVDRRGPDECWLWRGCLRSNGYGYMGVIIDGRQKKISAHRLAFLFHYGYLPEAPLLVRHAVCGHRICCNPHHLQEGTSQDDADDRLRMGRVPRGEQHPLRLHPDRLARGERNGMYTHPETRLRGEQNKNATLTDALVLEIRGLYAQGWTITALAKRFGVGTTTIRRVVRGETWCHVGGPVWKPEGPFCGTRCHLAKLTDDDVHTIRQLYAAGMTQAALAERFGVSQANISDIVRYRTWKHVA